MKTNEFLLIRENIPVKCSALAVLYSEDSNRGFVIYNDGSRKNQQLVLKIGELKEENDEIIIDDLESDEEIDYVWSNFVNMNKNAIANLNIRKDV